MHARPRLCMLYLCIHAVSAHAQTHDECNTQTQECVLTSVQATTTDDTPAPAQNTLADSVRYDTRAQIDSDGRFGAKGLAITGVDGNRVALNLDGVPLPKSEVNAIFSRYGYMPEGRPLPANELMGHIDIATGAQISEGALGGQANFSSKHPDELLQGRAFGGYLKSSYTHKNEAKQMALGMAGDFGLLKMLVNIDNIDGHEHKNHAMYRHLPQRTDPAHTFLENELGAKSIYPDSQNTHAFGALQKIIYENDNHRALFSHITQRNHNQGLLLSKGTHSGQRRVNDDTLNLQQSQLQWRYLPNHAHINALEIGFTRQGVDLHAGTTVFSEAYKGGLSDSYTLEGRYHQDYSTGIYTSGEFAFGKSAIGVRGELHKDTLRQWQKNGIGDSNGREYYTGAITMPSVHSHRASVLFNMSRAWGDGQINGAIGYNSRIATPFFDDDAKKTLHATPLTQISQDYTKGKYDNLQVRHQGVSAELSLQKPMGAFDVRYKIAHAVNLPTMTQMFSAFSGFGNREIPNHALKPEKAISHSLTIAHDFNHDFGDTALQGNISLEGYRSDYRDFIDVEFSTKGNEGLRQYQNFEHAHIYGARLGLRTSMPWRQGLLGMNAHLEGAKDGTSRGSNLLANPAPRATVGIDFDKDDWSIHARIVHQQHKKAKDARVVNDGIASTSNLVRFAKDYTTLDIFAQKNIGKHLIGIGVYNLTDKRYYSWATIKGLIDDISINNTVDKNGIGMARLSEAGRHMAINWRYDF